MSTNSIIGTGTVEDFTGRYCHWDGYPSGKGAQLIETFTELGNAQAVMDYAIRPDATGYWSSFGCPSWVADRMLSPKRVPCHLCNGTGVRTDMRVPDGCNGCKGTLLAHNFNRTSTWVKNDEGLTSPHETGGIEWAYLLDEDGIKVLKCTDHDETFRTVATVAWTDTPDWQAIDYAC